MSTPWPDDVLDCAKRLAKSLEYEDRHVMEVDGVVEVYRQVDWAIPSLDPFFFIGFDPRDPTVWSALIGFDEVTGKYPSGKLQRLFVRSHRDYSRANSKGSRGVYRRFKRPYSVRLKDGLAGARRLPAQHESYR